MSIKDKSGLKSERGITLVALIITIIILIILAAVTIYGAFKSNFINIAGNSAINYAEAQTKEEETFQTLDEKINEALAKIQSVNLKDINTPYAVILDANGGKFKKDFVVIQGKGENEEVYISDEIPEYSGWTFLGYTQDKKTTNVEYMPGDVYKENQDLVLYALWMKEITLSYDANGGTGTIENQKSQIYSNNKKVNITNGYYTQIGKVLLGFNENKESKEVKYLRGNSYEFEEDKILYAVWQDAGGQEFAYTGEAQKYTLYKDKLYKIECWGAQGGYDDTTGAGGLGAYTSGIVKLNEDREIFIYVGNTSTTYNVSAWNNGSVGAYGSDYNGAQHGCSGGGATDIRINMGQNKTEYNNEASLKSRIMVAAGGGRRRIF